MRDLIRVADLEPGFSLASHHSVVEYKLVLVFSVHAGSTRQVVCQVLEQVQLLGYQVLLEYRPDMYRYDSTYARDAGLPYQLVRDPLGVVPGGPVRDVNCNVLWSLIVIKSISKQHKQQQQINVSTRQTRNLI